MDAVYRDQNEEFPVVVCSDAIIEPKTVMVKALNTFVALSTMLCRGIGPLFTDDTGENFLSHLAEIGALFAFHRLNIEYILLQC